MHVLYSTICGRFITRMAKLKVQLSCCFNNLVVDVTLLDILDLLDAYW